MWKSENSTNFKTLSAKTHQTITKTIKLNSSFHFELKNETSR